MTKPPQQFQTWPNPDNAPPTDAKLAIDFATWGEVEVHKEELDTHHTPTQRQFYKEFAYAGRLMVS